MIRFLKDKLSGNSLKARFFRGSAWLAMGNIAEKILAFASKVILAHILMPEELGVIVLIASITLLFDCLTEVGVKQCIIQNKRGDTYEFLNSAFWFQSLRTSGLFIVAWIITPWVCRFYFDGKDQVLQHYDWPTLYLMVRMAFLYILLNGFVSPRTSLMEKNFRFARVVAYVQSAAITGIVLTIVLSFILRNAWAMVIGFICQAFLRMVLSYVFCPFKPRFEFHKESWKEIIQFARGMFGAPIFTYIAYNIDILVGGKIVGPELIGLYGFAKGLAFIPRDLFSRITAPLLIPSFSECQEDKQRLKIIIYRIMSIVLAIVIPCVLFCFLFHKQLIVLVYGQKFEQVSFVFAIMTVNVTLIIISAVFAGVVISLGRPGISRNSTFIRAALMVAMIIPVTKQYGLIGMTLVQVFANFILVAILYFQVRKMITLQSND